MIGDLESQGWLEMKISQEIPDKSRQLGWSFCAKGCITEKGVHSILQLAPHRLVKGAPRNSFCVKSYERAKLGVFWEICDFWYILETQMLHIGDATRRQLAKMTG